MELDQVQGLSMQDKTSRGRLYYFWYWTIKRYFCIRCCPRRHSTTRYLCLTKYIDTLRLPFLHKVPISSNDSGIELCVVHPDIQKSLWNSVVQITIDDTAGSAIIVEEADDFFFLLTNLHLFDDRHLREASVL